MDAKTIRAYRESCTALLGLSVVSVGFLFVRMLATGSTRYWFLSWNLILAWAPVLFAILLAGLLVKKRWSSWQPLTLTIAWLLFLPNSFYLMTDLLHTNSTGEVSALFDIVMFGAFAVTGLLLGFLGLLIVHRELNKRLEQSRAVLFILLAILLSSFAIYMGRYLRWNSWDILINPASLLVDVSDRLARPSDYPGTFGITLIFFIFISGFYFGFLRLVRALRDLVK